MCFRLFVFCENKLPLLQEKEGCFLSIKDCSYEDKRKINKKTAYPEAYEAIAFEGCGCGFFNTQTRLYESHAEYIEDSKKSLHLLYEYLKCNINKGFELYYTWYGDEELDTNALCINIDSMNELGFELSEQSLYTVYV